MMVQPDIPPESRDIRRRVLKIDRLEAMPQVAWQLVAMLGDDRTSASSLERVIESDIALASKVLSLANSAFYGMPQKITTIQRAVVIIGFDELRLLVLGTGLFKIFDSRRAPEEFDWEGLWRHSLGVSWLAKELAAAVGHPAPAEAMIAGLLHDLGKFVLATYFGQEFAKILQEVEKGAPYFQAEEGNSLRHDLIGYWLAEGWGLPTVHTAAIRDHHRPKVGDSNFGTTALVLLANLLVKKLGIGVVHQSPPVDWRMCMESLGLNEQRLRPIYTKSKEQLPGIVEGWMEVFVQRGAAA